MSTFKTYADYRRKQDACEHSVLVGQITWCGLRTIWRCLDCGKGLR